jgi:predicted metal-dependent hydrolase
MSKRILIIASVIGVVFLFAGYNLYSYFQTQAVIAMEKERAAEVHQRESERRSAERDAEKRQLEAERLAEAEHRKLQAIEQDNARERERLKSITQDQKEADERRAAQAAILAVKQAEYIAKRTENVRTIWDYAGFSLSFVQQVRDISPQLFIDNPEEALGDIETSNQQAEAMFTAGTSVFSILAMMTLNTDVLQAVLDSGVDINKSNSLGVTPLMFAARYNSPEIITFLLSKGADVNARSYVQDMNALEIAASLNPNPDMVKALVEGGADINKPAMGGDTPLILAARLNPNIEVPARLAELGADKEAYHRPSGQTAYAIVRNRLDAGTPPLIEKIHETVSKISLNKLK